MRAASTRFLVLGLQAREQHQHEEWRRFPDIHDDDRGERPGVAQPGYRRQSDDGQHEIVDAVVGVVEQFPEHADHGGRDHHRQDHQGSAEAPRPEKFCRNIKASPRPTSDSSATPATV